MTTLSVPVVCVGVPAAWLPDGGSEGTGDLSVLESGLSAREAQLFTQASKNEGTHLTFKR
ncbi:MAG: hypothetical protein QXL34_07575 [Thermosphaera sp.]